MINILKPLTQTPLTINILKTIDCNPVDCDHDFKTIELLRYVICSIMVFMSEIKFSLTLKQIKFSVPFMLLLAIIMFLPTRQLSRQKTYFFPSNFASISSCSVCLVGLIRGRNIVLYLENEPKYHFNN